jgi:hypothetical protein
MTRWSVILATLALVLSVAKAARAQGVVAAGELGVGTGLEAGDPGTGKTTFHRARTRIFVGVDTRLSDDRAERLGFVVFADLEPHTGLGGSVRYLHFLGKHAVGFVGLTGAIAPHTLFGGEAGLKFVIGGGDLKFFLEPSIAALPLGTDLPTDRVLLWGLLALGVHAEL